MREYRKNLTACRFGRLLVTGESRPQRTPNGATKRMWVCRCDCGQMTVVRQEHLQAGRSASCGCLQKERAAATSYRHGGRSTKLYDVWTQMLQRCENPKNRNYHNYGGRGIEVCAKWHDYAVFAAEMGSPPAGLEIDRVDNDGNYEKGNCRWTTDKGQARNQRRTIFIPHKGQTKTLMQWAEEIGLKPGTLYRRIVLRGESPPEAFRPVTPQG